MEAAWELDPGLGYMKSLSNVFLDSTVFFDFWASDLLIFRSLKFIEYLWEDDKQTPLDLHQYPLVICYVAIEHGH